MGTKDNAASYFGFAQEYVASFGISQIALKLSDKGLQITTDVLELTGLEGTKPIKPVVDGIEILRRYGRAVRRAGAKMAGIQPAKTIGEASVVGAVAEVLGLNFFLSVVGLQLVPANILQKSTTGELDTTTEEETVDKLSDEKIAGYLSDEDPDYVPNGVTEESAEEDSDVDVGEEKEGDDIEEIKEVAETTEISREEAVSKIGAVVENTVKETEDITEARDIVGKIVDETDDKIEDVVEEVVEEAKTVDEDVENLLENIKKLTVEETEVVVKEVESKIEEVVEKTVEETADTIEETEDIVEKIVEDKIEDVVEEVVREAEEKFVEGSWLSQIVKKVEDAVESVTDTIEDTVDAVEIEDVEDINNVEEADLAEELD